MVSPFLTSSRMTSSTSPTISGSRALVGSSNRSTSGNLVRFCVDIRIHTDLSQVFHRRFFSFLFTAFQDLYLTCHTVLKHGHIVEKIELLESQVQNVGVNSLSVFA